MTGKDLDRRLSVIAADLVDALRGEPVPAHILDLARQLQAALEAQQAPVPEVAPD